MNDIYLKNYTTKAHPMVDFNYKIKDSKTPRRRSIFQILSPKKNSKNLMMHNNPKEIFNANNKINSILSKNLKSIYNENKNNISSDNPLYKSVNCLIKKIIIVINFYIVQCSILKIIIPFIKDLITKKQIIHM